jgi:hypothetical protein
MSTDFKQLEFELEKARNGLAMPYDPERVWQLEAQLRERVSSCGCAKLTCPRPTFECAQNHAPQRGMRLTPLPSVQIG